MKRNFVPFALLVALTIGVFAPVSAAQKVRAALVTGGLNDPLLALSPPNDFDRMFILEQNTGQIRIFKAGMGLLGTPFLDINAISSSGGERGLLGMAFHPDYANNGYFFINFTDNGGNTVVARYTVSANPDIADAGSGQSILTAGQPFSNHNGGHLAFGPDGYLYIGLGDGGSAGDPGNRSQDGSTFLGKMLRIDVDSASPYAIPNDNPFVGNPAFLDEIWAYGLRNPWRYAFDRETGDLWIADVGQGDLEEVDFQPANSTGGENYGWRLMEGTDCFNPSQNCNNGSLELPLHEYRHTFFPLRCSITGGFVYRGDDIPGLQGTYFYADYCSNEVWTIRNLNGTVVDFKEITGDLGSTINGPTSFGEDAAGELYIVAGSAGQVWKIVPDLFSISTGPIIAGQSATLNISNASANSTIYIAVSFTGQSVTRVPQLGVAVALDAPQLVGTTNTNGAGAGSFTGNVPAATSGRTVYIQAIENGNVSNLIVDTIQ